MEYTQEQFRLLQNINKLVKKGLNPKSFPVMDILKEYGLLNKTNNTSFKSMPYKPVPFVITMTEKEMKAFINEIMDIGLKDFTQEQKETIQRMYNLTTIGGSKNDPFIKECFKYHGLGIPKINYTKEQIEEQNRDRERLYGKDWKINEEPKKPLPFDTGEKGGYVACFLEGRDWLQEQTEAI
jgi:hypothetical protein